MNHHLKALIGCEAARRPEPRVTCLPTPSTPRRRLGAVPRRLDRAEVGRMLNTILETYDGHRPAAQIQRLVDKALLDRLSGPRLARTRHRAKSVHTCGPATGVIEASARVEAGERVYALAARFERKKTGWVCTRFHVLDPEAGMRAAA